MGLPPFKLERFLALHEFSVPNLLCASDCESLSVKELLDYEPNAREAFEKLWLGYTTTQGDAELRAQIARLYESISEEQILVHSGAGEPIYAFMQLFLRPGDRVLVQWPCYQSLFQVAESAGCEVLRWEGNPEKNWALDLNVLKSALATNLKAVVLNQPHNPTGYLMERAMFQEIARMTSDAGALLFCDEVYRGLEYDEHSRLPAACSISETAVSLGVMSKAFGLAGLRIGWIATRNRSLLKQMLEFKDYTTICASAPGEFLAALALRHKNAVLRRNLGIIQSNLIALDTLMEKHRALLRWTRPIAGCIGFAEFLGNQTTDVLAEDALAKAGVLLAPSSKFGFGSRHFRIGYGRKSALESIRHFDAYLSTISKYMI